MLAIMKIRASSLPTYSDCARRGVARQFPQLLEQLGHTEMRGNLPSAGGAVGNGLHIGAARLLEAKRDGTECSEADAVEQGIEAMDAEAAEGAEWDDHTPDANTGHKQIQRMIRAFIRGPLQRLDPLHIELYMEADAGDGVILTGHVDLITTDHVIRDLKNGNVQRPFQAQLGAYSLLARSNPDMTGINYTAGLGVEYLYRARLNAPQPDAVPHDFDVPLCERAALASVRQIKRDVRALEASGDCWDVPANPNSMMCTRAYCPAWGTSFCDLGHTKGTIE